MSIPRLKIWLEGRELDTFFSIAHEFCECGKAATLGLTANSNRGKSFKFNDADYLCVYDSIVRVMNSGRYPTKEGAEFIALGNIKLYLETEFKEQRGLDIAVAIKNATE